MRARSVAGVAVIVLVIAGLAGIGAVAGCALDAGPASCRARSSLGILGTVALIVGLIVYLGAWERDQHALRKELARLEHEVDQDETG